MFMLVRRGPNGSPNNHNWFVSPERRDTVYNDAAHEVRSYPGWHEVSEGVYQT